jgi:hypothetical protein
LVRWVNESAFASTVQARPCPTFGRPVHRRGGPHRLRPGTSPHALRIPPHDGHPALQSYYERWLQVRLGCFRLSLSCPFRFLHTFQLSPASEALPPPSDTIPLIRASEGLKPSRTTRCSAHTVRHSDFLPPLPRCFVSFASRYRRCALGFVPAGARRYSCGPGVVNRAPQNRIHWRRWQDLPGSWRTLL